MENTATRLEDIWRVLGIMSLLLCGCAEAVALCYHEERVKKKLESLAVALLLLYIATDVVAFGYERKAREATNTLIRAFGASFQSSLDEIVFRSRAKVEAARHSKGSPQVEFNLEPVLTGFVSVVVQSSNFIPFRYRYKVTTGDGNTLCGAPWGDVYPNGVPFTIGCSFSVDSVRDSVVQLEAVTSSIPEGNSVPPESRQTLKYTLAIDKFSLHRVE